MGLAELALAQWRAPRPQVREWPVGVGTVPPGSGDFGWRNTDFSPESYLDYIATSNEIFSAVMLRARLMSSLRLGLFRGDDADKTPMPDHPASRLLKHVNPFWCVDEQTEALTARGWVSGRELTTDDLILSMRPGDGQLVWSPVKSVNRKQYVGMMHHLRRGPVNALVTPGHTFPLMDGQLLEVEKLRQGDVIRVMGSPLLSVDNASFSDAFVELVGWVVTEGHLVRTRRRTGRRGERPVYGDYRPVPTTITISQKDATTRCERIKEVLKEAGARWHESLAGQSRTVRAFSVTGEMAQAIMAVAPDRILSPAFLTALTADQRELLINVMIDADGSISGSGSRCFHQKDKSAVDAFVMLCALAGYSTSATRRTWTSNHYGGPVWTVTIRSRGKTVRPRRRVPADVPYKGMVWCPETEFGTFVCRRAGTVFVTGNTERRLAMMDELSMGLMGQSFWAVEHTGTGRRRTPSEIWWMKPSRVLPKLDSENYITGWLYEPIYGGQDVQFEADEVVWFRYPNPIDEFSPLSPLAAARLAADTAIAMQRSNRNLFRQGLQIAGLIVPPADKVTFSKPQAEELEQQLERRFAGADKAHRWAVLRYEAQFKQLTISPKDAEFLGGLNLTLRQVANAYGIPAPLLNDLDSATLANVSEYTKILWAHTLVPDSQLRAAEIVEQFLPRFGADAPDHAEYDYTKVAALQESATETWLRDAQAIDRGALTVNEWRRRNGLPDVPWGDVYWAPVNKAPVTDASSNPAAEQGGGDDNESRPADDERNPVGQPETRLYDHHTARRMIADASNRFDLPVRPVNGHRVLTR